VTDFVPEHCRQLSLGVEIAEQPAGDVDVAARQREGVDFVAVEDGEVECQVGQMTDSRKTLPYLADKRLQLRVVVDAVILQGLLVCLQAQTQLLIF
jgi:hypothetical protein